MKSGTRGKTEEGTDGARELELVRVRGGGSTTWKNVDVDIPRDARVVFTGVSGSGKSPLAADAAVRYPKRIPSIPIIGHDSGGRGAHHLHHQKTRAGRDG